MKKVDINEDTIERIANKTCMKLIAWQEEHCPIRLEVERTRTRMWKLICIVIAAGASSGAAAPAIIDMFMKVIGG